MDDAELLTELLLLDALDVLLELGLEHGYSDAICFLAEADRVRLPDDSVPTPSRQDRTLRYLDKVDHVVSSAGVDVQALRQTLSLRIPFPTVFVSACDAVYSRVQQHVREMPVAAVVRKIEPRLDSLKPELSSVLKAPVSRRYYERFLSTNRPSDQGSLQCWGEVTAILQSVHEYILPAPSSGGGDAGKSASTSSAAAAASVVSASATGTSGSPAMSAANDKKHSSTASKGAMDALLTGSGATAAAASASYLLGETLSDPLRVFSLLLAAMRQLQRRFFSASTDKQPLGNSIALAGISDSLRMELATTLNMTSSVRGNDIESIDTAFAATCAGRMVRLLRFVERETFQHLQLQFPAFVQSPEYYLSLVAARAEKSDAVEQYRSRRRFLEHTVVAQKSVSWTDPEAFGNTFLYCCGGEDVSGRADLLGAAPGLLLRGPRPPPAGTASSPTIYKMWNLSGNNCKLANPFSLNQEALRNLVAEVWAEVERGSGLVRGGSEDEAEVCVSISIDLKSPIASLLLPLLVPSPDAASKLTRGEYISLAVSSNRLQQPSSSSQGQLGLACSLCFPPTTPLIQGLRRSSQWALNPEGSDCSQFNFAVSQRAAAATPQVSLLDVYGLDSQSAPHEKHLGECDISIKEVVESLGTRLTVQILLLLLTNRSALLVSRSATQLSRLMAVLPRLAWPFPLAKTHKLAAGHFSSVPPFEDWVRSDLKPSNGTGSAWLATALATTYDSSSVETKRIMATLQGAGSAGSSHTGLFIFNVDSCVLINPGLVSKQGFSKLTDPSLLQKLNSSAFRSLALAVSQGDNKCCQMAFLKYFVDIFLRHLPPTIHHFPQQRVVACEVKKLLADLPRPSTNAAHGGTGPGSPSEIEVEFATELVGLSSPPFLALLERHEFLFNLTTVQK